MNMKCGKEEKSQPFFQSDFCFRDSSSSTAWLGGVAQSNKEYIFYTSISPPITFIYLSCAVPGDWSVSTAWNERKERSVFYVLYILQKNILLALALGGVAICTSEALHRLTFFELADEKCSNSFVCQSLKMYGWSEAFAAESGLPTGNVTKAVAQVYFQECRMCVNMQNTLQDLRIPDRSLQQFINVINELQISTIKTILFIMLFHVIN